MRKFLLYSSALALGLSGAAEAACIQTPTCSSLGYTSSSSCDGGIKCPFGNAWNCTAPNKITELEKILEELKVQISTSNCKVGDILYSDMTCGENLYPDKTAIGVVFDAAKGLAIAKDEFTDLAWGASGDISGIQNYADSSTSIADWQGFNNTKAMYDYEKSLGGYYPSMEKVLLYSTTGTSQGQWYLPAAGELKAISDNKDALNIALSKIGGTQMSGSYWTSSEQNSNNVWRINLGESFSNTGKADRGTAKPVINFASKDKISVDLKQSTTCKVGDILYSDKTCSTNFVSGKTPIGVVFSEVNRLAIALDSSIGVWSTENVDILGIDNIYGGNQLNYVGKNNTSVIVSQGITKYPAAKYAYYYTTSGTKTGDWYLPAGGELLEIYKNKNALNVKLRALNKNELFNVNYWSSSEKGDGHAWKVNVKNGYASIENKDVSCRVLPVLAF